VQSRRGGLCPKINKKSLFLSQHQEVYNIVNTKINMDVIKIKQLCKFNMEE
jgi:hypothetical protein